MFHEDSFHAWLAYERRFAANTLLAYRRDLGLFVTYLSQEQCLTSVAEVRHLHIRSWIVAQLQGGDSTRTVNRRLSCLKTYFKFLQKRGHIDRDPMRKVVAPKSGQRLPVVVQEPEVQALFTTVEFPDTYRGKLDRLVLEVLYGTGLRRGEAAALRVRDVDVARSVLRVQGKGGKERLVPFGRYLGVLLDDYLQARRAAFTDTAETALFLTADGRPVTVDIIYYIVKKYLSRVTSVEQRSPHVLRHSYATHLSNRGADLNAIKELLGHSSLAATQVYMHNTIERLKEVYEQAHPKAEQEGEG